MQVAGRHGSRLAARASMGGISRPVASRLAILYVCQRCQSTAVNRNPKLLKTRDDFGRSLSKSRQFSVACIRRDEVKSKDRVDDLSQTAAAEPNGSTHATQRKKLPSQQAALRFRLSKYLNKAMDDLMPKLAVASQRINTYTGTDYTAIESLRKDIREQEELVKTRYNAHLLTKESLESARTAESLSRKEVVSLLERRHSWSDPDLERYMSLIRSEHLNDQAVQTAKDNVTAAEQALDEARNKLEKMERMQYHEEQIWSDTIRRNSTWVTFGLMGVNILLLLVTVGVAEPWRRRRMVGEIKAALEEKLGVFETAAAAVPLSLAPADVVSMPESSIAQEKEIQAAEAITAPAEVVVAAVEEVPAEPSIPPLTADISPPPPPAPQTLKETAKDLFSERAVSLRQRDVSAIAIESAATGALIAAIMMGLWRTS